jgi:hypothetical protein
MIKNNVQIFDLLNNTKKGKESNIIFRQKGRSSKNSKNDKNKKPIKPSNQGITLNFYMGNGGLLTRPHIGFNQDIPRIEELQAINLNTNESINNKLDEMLRRPQADNTELGNQINQLYEQQSRMNRALPVMMNQLEISNIQSGIGMMSDLNRNAGRRGRNEMSASELQNKRNESILAGLDELEKRGIMNEFSQEIRRNLRSRCEDSNAPGCFESMMPNTRSTSALIPVPEEPSTSFAPALGSTPSFTPVASRNNGGWSGGLISSPRVLDLGNIPTSNSMNFQDDDVVSSILQFDDEEAAARISRLGVWEPNV